MIQGHDLSTEKLYEILDSKFEGLTSKEAEERIVKYGYNRVSTEKKINPFKIFFSQFKNLLVIILIIAGVINGVIGIIDQKTEAIIDVVAIVLVVLINAFLGFYQEFSAEKAIKALKKLAESEVIVVRDGKKLKLDSEVLVPGDIIIIEAGDTVSADIRLIQSYEIRTNEGILTGESTTTRKHTKVLPSDTPLADRKNMIYKGTTIVNGSGMGIVVNTSASTELGKIAASLVSIESEETPIQRKLQKLGGQLTIVVVVLSIIIFGLGVLSLGIQSWSAMIIFAIGLAVAAVPEGLPTVLTLSLALGITRLSKKNALIRKLPAVEVLGASTIICTDKTGTLTRNEQTVKLLWTIDRKFNVTGEGYYGIGNIVEKETAMQELCEDQDSVVIKAIEIGALANEASIEFQGSDKPYKIFGDPTEVALLILAEKGQSLKTINDNWSIEYLFPFDSDRKRMSAITKNKKTGEFRIMVKGAVDVLLDLTNTKFAEFKKQPLSETEKKEIMAVAENYSASYAYRLLGLAYRDIDKETAEKLILSKRYENVEKDLTFVGFVGMIDPPRSQTRIALEKANEAGIDVVMITGDHVATAKAIGNSIGMCIDSDPIDGKLLNRMTDEELSKSVQTTDIFARVNPSHKLRIVNALKDNGEIVTMTGDGVNDAPALKRADIGVAMGIAGTDVAKEASEMILLDDDFSNIIEAISEGRTIYSNIKKFIGYLLSANAGEILTVLFGVIIGLLVFQETIIPIVTIQLLYINIVTDTFPALALGISPAEMDVMRRPPRDPEEPLIDKNMIIMILVSGLLYAVGAMLAYFWSMDFTLSNDPEIVKAAETMVFVSLVLYQLFHSLSVSQSDLIIKKSIFRNGKLFGAIFISLTLLIAAVYIPGFNGFIQAYPLKALHWGKIIAITAPIVIIDELRKYITNKLQKQKEPVKSTLRKC